MQIGSFGDIPIDFDELIDFQLSMEVMYSINPRPRYSTQVRHTGISQKRGILKIRTVGKNRWNPWNNLRQNYNKLAQRLIIAGNFERDWVLESLDNNLIDLVSFTNEITIQMVSIN